MTTVSLKELRPRIPSLIDRVEKKFDRFTVTRRGRPVAVLMSVDDYECIQETLDMLSDKAGLSRLKKGLGEIRKAKTVSLTDIRRKLEHV